VDQVLGLRPFVPAREFDVSRRFYEALGFTVTHADDSVAMLKLGSFSFILQNFYVQAFAENCMQQLLVRDAARWWAEADPDRLVESFGVKPPRAPAMQPWGMKVGFIFDPCGVLWHIAEVLF
jgi:uncharacterized glyoxalase superfamily protein PhnB